MSSPACELMGVAYAHNPGVCMPCGARAIPLTWCRAWWLRISLGCSWRRSPQMSSPVCCKVGVWSLGVG